MEKPVLKLLIQQEDLIVKRIKKFGMGCGKFGLIHADMRLANLLIHEGKTRLIDFDDCGIGWFLYDFAAGISFMEDNPTVETLKDAWVRGYRNVSSLSNEEEKEIDTHSENFSPNVLLRPLYQERVLPNIATIGGGAEVAYWLQLKSSFQQEKIPFPILVLRNSAMLITDKQMQKIKSFGLGSLPAWS